MEKDEIRIGNFDYSVFFLQSLFDEIRMEKSTFAANLLKLWEDSKSSAREEIHVHDNVAEVNRTALERQVENENVLLGKDD